VYVTAKCFVVKLTRIWHSYKVCGEVNTCMAELKIYGTLTRVWHR